MKEAQEAARRAEEEMRAKAAEDVRCDSPGTDLPLTTL